MDIVPANLKVKVTVHTHCTGPEGSPPCEYLVYLAVPKAGGDGLLLGVTETSEAAEHIASALNSVIGLAHTHA